MLAQATRHTLVSRGYVVDHVSTAAAGLQMGCQEDYKIAILDIGLPDGSGLDILRGWRASRVHTLVLLLTARDNWQDKVNGLQAGADDYLAKPFHVEELMARLDALIRRSEGRVDNHLHAGSLTLDTDRQQVDRGEDSWHALTATEFRLLRTLMSHPGRIFSKRELVDQLYDLDSEASSNTIEAYIHRLRSIVGKETIVTLRGQGYSLHA